MHSYRIETDGVGRYWVRMLENGAPAGTSGPFATDAEAQTWVDDHKVATAATARWAADAAKSRAASDDD